MAELSTQQSDPPVVPQDTVPSTGNNDVEVGIISKSRRKRKTTQNDQSHGSFFLRIGAIGKFACKQNGDVEIHFVC